MARQDADASPGPGSPAAPRDERAERLAAALRENLRRRKAQARGRRQESGEGARQDRDGESQDGENGETRR